MFFMILLLVLALAKTVGEDLIQDQAYEKLADAGHAVVAELNSRVVMSTTLVTSMAKIATALPAEDALLFSSIPSLMNQKGYSHLIAGGGVWPEPFKYRSDRERYSFFWGRNANGTLEFYDDYNLAAGAGYHNEEWYVPVKHLKADDVYWSKSYTDPHSLQPMVTVSAPITRDGQNIGVTTIDLKLEGLQELLKQATQGFGGYAFAIDRNGRFLAFPDDSIARNPDKTVADGSLIPFMTIHELAETHSIFKPIDDLLLEKPIDHHISDVEELEHLAEKMASESYQIELPEARLIATDMLSNHKSGKQQLHEHEEPEDILPDDHFLKEAVFVSITTMPDTFWRIVTVMPDSAARREATELFNLFISVAMLAVLIAMFVVWLLLRRNLTLPLSQLAQQIKNSIWDDEASGHLIKTTDKGELGALAHSFNRRTEQFLESQKQIKSLAFYDSLTGLPNRRMLLDRLRLKLAMANRNQTSGAVLFLDLDNFKHLNDSLGHSTGDELLVKVGERLKKCMRGEDTVARIGGDEFVILITTKSSTAQEAAMLATTVASKIIDTLTAPFDLFNNNYHITASIGISLFPQEDQEGFEDILKQADTAMYHSKSHGRNSFSFFEPEMQRHVNERLRILEDLRSALENNELMLMYQPQVDVNGSCSSVEALVRWNHPTDGMIFPGIFIPIVEESMLIVPFGKWILREACRQMHKWNTQGRSLDHISINVSPRQFQQPGFLDEVRDAITDFNIQPQQLMLELTEGVIMENTEEAIHKMQILKSLGIRVSLDDFGTGYSSLTYLKQLPLDEVKIDQSFVSDITDDPNDVIIVKTIIAMASHLGYEVIAEGVETEEQLRILVNKGCKHFQGYFFSRPLPAEDLEKFFELNEETVITGLFPSMQNE
jgi:diguanylate cyclase (GGDEF)-like protein